MTKRRYKDSSELNSAYTVEQLEEDLCLLSAAEGTNQGEELAKLIVSCVMAEPDGEAKAQMLERISRYTKRNEAEWESQYPMEMTPMATAFAQKELVEMSEAGELGNVVVDFGAGINPVTKNLKSTHRVIEVDLWTDEGESEEGRLCLKLDLKKVEQCSQDCREALGKVVEFLQIEDEEQLGGKADVFVFSSILNYLDYENVVAKLLPYLNENGKIVVMNAPNEGVVKYLSPKRPRNNVELVSFFRLKGFQVERARFPRSSDNTRPSSDSGHMEDMIFLVLRK